MIELTKLNGDKFWLNPHLIEFMEATPDTVIVMQSGKHMLAKERVDEVIERIIVYRRKLGCAKQEE